jgi:hypothetical protein
VADADGVFRPNWGIQTIPVFKTLVTSTDAGGLGIRRQKWQSAVCRIVFTSTHATVAEAQAVLAFFTGKKGSRTTFTWTNPDDGLVYTCRFASDQISRTRSGPGHWEFDIELLATR